MKVFGQRRVVHADAAAQPLEADVLEAQPVQLARAAHALHRGVESQRQQDAWVSRWMPGAALDRLDRVAYSADRSSRSANAQTKRAR